MPNSRCMVSPTFRIGGHSWCIDLYPNGRWQDDLGYTSVFLRFRSYGIGSNVTAQCCISLVHNNGWTYPSPRRTCKFYTGSCCDGHARFFKNQDLERSGLLVDDCFTIRVDIAVQGEFPFRKENIAVAQALAAPKPPPLTVVPPPTASLRRHLGDLLSRKEGADVTFMVGDEAFAAHRCILAARSPVFKAQLFGAMKESAGTTKDDAVRVEDMAPQAFEALLCFLYTDCLPSSDSETPEKEQDVTMAQHLLVAADRYDLDKLKLICEERLCECIDAGNAVTILALAEQYSCTGLKQACLNVIRSTNDV